MSIATKIKKELARFLRRLGLAPTEPAQTPAEAPQKREEAPDAATTPEPPPTPVETRGGGPRMDWRYGGFDGSRAVEDENTQISDLHMTRGGLRYKWARGNLRNWGLADTDAGALACVGFWEGGTLVIGKIDWISTSRTTRDFQNLDDGYRGWKPALFWGAKKRAFCIASKDGKRRTNILETEEPN